MVTPPLIYVAAPYNDPDPTVVQRRMDTVTYELAVLALKGSVAFSPLLMHFCLNTGIELPSDYKFWENFCLTMLSKSDVLVVLTLPGWAESSGVQSEISFAKGRDIPIFHQPPSLRVKT
jgi:hypothetical protein